VQEIYGITEANNAQSGTDDDFSAHCVVCLTNRKNTTVLPCRHFCMCDECAKLLLKRTRTCPMCRLPISSVLNIQIRQSDANGVAAAPPTAGASEPVKA
jgi:E3 ubiquitin-protein ligase MGRN1